MSSLIPLAESLKTQLRGLPFPSPVTHTYNPLEYAWESHKEYLKRFGSGKKKVVLLGMNPGPWGMSQTGVPFGEIPAVRDWMGIETPIGKPENEHPKREVVGFHCEKSEVSGRRLWGLFAERYGTAEAFFTDHFVINYCPLVWMGETGANITPDKLKKEVMQPVHEACMEHLEKAITALQPDYLIGVGAFAEKRFLELRKKKLISEQTFIGKILHPSPASPAANRGWDTAATKQLIEQGVWQ